MKGGKVMSWILLFLLLVIIALLIVIIRRDPAFGKEFGEAMLAMWTSAKDGRLTADEKAVIKREWQEVDWKSAFKKVLQLLK